VIPKPFSYLLAAVLTSTAVFAQKPAGKPLSESDLLKQIEALTPSSAKSGAEALSPSNGKSAAPTPSLFEPNTLNGDLKTEDKKDKENSPEKKSKGPTEITALEATFDQKKNVAVFIGSVVVKDPEFNVVCDKLTAHLKHEEKPPATPPPTGKTKATPTPKPATPKPEDASVPKKKSGGLEKAVAETTSERRVIITQDKVEADGTITHSIGKSDVANYDAVTGDIVLTGTPDVTQGINRVIATAPTTVMTLNRDGRMRAEGPHKTIIVDKGDAGL
jgi:lipopolysaccharide export system protein LptA